MLFLIQDGITNGAIYALLGLALVPLLARAIRGVEYL